MKTKSQKRIKFGQRALMLVGVFLATAVVVCGANYGREKSAEAISPACANSADCMAAVKKEQEANENAAAAQNTSNMYQNKVNELNIQIAAAERLIAESKARVSELNAQIKETEAKLNDEQEALAELLIDMHFEGDSEPITILAGSSSISDLAEKQARNEVVKQQISATATKIKEAKEKLESDRAEVERQLEAQEQMKSDLAASRAEQKELVAKYANDAAAYEEIARAAIEAQHEAELAEIAKHPDLYKGGGSYLGINGFPWRNQCPENNLNGVAYLNGDWNYPLGAMCQCTSYAGWKAWDVYSIALDWGTSHAYDWHIRAENDGYHIDHIPEKDTLGASGYDGSAFGHVWWVESVNADGSVNITEYNNPYATCLYQNGGDENYCGWAYVNYPGGDFGSRTMSAWTASQYWYVHFR